MAAPDEVYREFGRRANRMMAAYLAVQAWTQDLDCVALDRVNLLSLWGLKKRVEHQRLNWLKEDVRMFFPYFRSLVFARGSTFSGVYLSRRQFPRGSFDQEMVDAKRALLLCNSGLKTRVIKLPSEADIMAFLTSVIHGLVEVCEARETDLGKVIY